MKAGHHVYINYSGENQLLDDESRHHDHNQEDYEDRNVLQLQGCSWWTFWVKRPNALELFESNETEKWEEIQSST